MIKLFDKIIFIFTLIALLGLIGAYASPYINPGWLVIPSLLGLAYPYLLIVNILLFLYWLVRWKKMALVSLLVLAAGIPFFMSYYGTHNTKGNDLRPDLSILSYNVRYFDKYGWSQNKHTYNKLIDYINRYKGDIVCLQEFPDHSYKIKPQNIVQELISYPYHFTYKDVAIFSRLPIVRQGFLSFDHNHTASALFCDIRKGEDTIRIYNIHLESYQLGQKERQFVKKISEGDSKEFSDGFKNIVTRLSKANKNRAIQAQQIRNHLVHSPHLAVVCGDFNDTPLSYTYRTINQNLKDSFIEKGRGLGNTYIGEFPSFRIDYILHSPTITTLTYTRGSVTLSDHYPISCQLNLPTKKQKK